MDDRSTTTDMTELWQGGPLFCQAEHFKLGTDSVLLADFTNTAGARRGIDLGGASGILGLLLLVKSERLHMTELELVPQACELARENMARNGLDARCEVVCGDIHPDVRICPHPFGLRVAEREFVRYLSERISRRDQFFPCHEFFHCVFSSLFFSILQFSEIPDRVERLEIAVMVVVRAVPGRAGKEQNVVSLDQKRNILERDERGVL